MSEYYFEIESSSLNYVLDRDRDIFTKLEIKAVNNIFPNSRIDFGDILKIIIDSEIYAYTKYSNILKLKDEWYIVSWSNKYENFKYYKCDQLEGLLKFLDDKKKEMI